MDALSKAEQDRMDALFEQLPAEQQAAILEREAVIAATAAEQVGHDGPTPGDDDEPFDNWKQHDHTDYTALADYYEGILAGE